MEVASGSEVKTEQRLKEWGFEERTKGAARTPSDCAVKVIVISVMIALAL